jgi:hypothetical protein
MADVRTFFVLRLSEHDFHPDPRAAYSVDLRNMIGLPSQFCYLDGQGTILCFMDPNGAVISERVFDVPPAVIAAAFRQAGGKGDYVDANGQSIRPF